MANRIEWSNEIENAVIYVCQCATCEHMVFDEKYGEYKCAVHHIRCYANAPIIINCKKYKEKKNGT